MKAKLAALLVVLLVLLIALPASHEPMPIRNGGAADEFPWVGLLRSRGSYCSATLEPHGNCIITAAHCVPESGSSRFDIRVGLNSNVSEFRQALKSADGTGADIAIGRLDKNISLPGTAPWTFPDGPLSEYVGTTVQVVGFGDRGGVEGEGPVQLRSGQMEFVQYIDQSFLDDELVSTTMELSPLDNSDNSLCEGDSGGATFFKSTFVGINSAGLGYEFPGVLCLRGKGARIKPMNLNVKSGDQTVVTVETFLADLALVKGKNTSRYSQDTARQFCQLLSKPEVFEKKIKSKGLRRDSKYFSTFRRLGGKRKSWRLPSRDDIRILKMESTSQQTKKNFYRFFISREDKELYWLSNKVDSLSGIAVAWETGAQYQLPKSPGTCDLQVESESVSLYHYLPWVQATLKEMGCYS